MISVVRRRQCSRSPRSRAACTASVGHTVTGSDGSAVTLRNARGIASRLPFQHRGGKLPARRTYLRPVFPPRFQVTVGSHLSGHGGVCRAWVGELASDRGGPPLAAAVLVCVVVVDAGENVGRLADAVVLGQRGNVKIVARLVAAHDEESLDPEGFLHGRNPQSPP